MSQTKPLLENETIGTYRLDTLLGKGSMGSVFKGKHTRLGRIAAIKILSDKLSQDEEYVSRFFHEAKIVNSIGHPNIIDIVDFIEQEKPRQVAYVMELIEGPSLAKGLEDHRFSLIQTLNIAEQIAAAMSAAHGVGVIHRDLKPDNVLLMGSLDEDFSQRPTVKVVDFGIAKSSDTAVRHQTVVGTVMGTPAYMAPEQVAALPTTPAVDVFALGEILFELLVGKRLFSGDPLEIMQEKISAKIPNLILADDFFMKDRLESLVNSCLSFQPDKRLTMEDLIQELRLIRKRSENELPTNSKDRASITNVAVQAYATLAGGNSFRSDKLNMRILVPRIFAVLLCLGLLLGGAYTLRSSQEMDTQATPIESVPLALQETVHKATKVKGKSAAIQTPTNVNIHVSSIPPGAKLHLIGHSDILGKTPLNLTVSKPNKYMLKLKGFRNEEMELGPQNKTVQVKLTPLTVRKKPRRRISRPEKTETKAGQSPSKQAPKERRKALKKSEVPAW